MTAADRTATVDRRRVAGRLELLSEHLAAAIRRQGADVEPPQDGRVRCWLAGGRITNRDELVETTGAGRALTIAQA